MDATDYEMYTPGPKKPTPEGEEELEELEDDLDGALVDEYVTALDIIIEGRTSDKISDKQLDHLLKKISELRGTPLPPKPDETRDDELTIRADLTSPVKRSNRRSTTFKLHRKAIEMSNKVSGKHGKHFTRMDDDSESDSEDSNAPDKKKTVRTNAPKIIILGEEVKLATKPNSITKTDFLPPKRYYLTKRKDLSDEAFDVFYKAATGFALTKDNKLEVVSLRHDDEKILFSIKNIQFQLQTLLEFCYKMDTLNVFTIVSPKDQDKTAAISSATYNLFEDYPVLHPAQVANSNAWCNTWVQTDPQCRSQTSPTHENLQITYEFIKKNTDTGLIAKAVEEHNEYLPVQQGGPLLLYLVLKKMLDVSETSLEYLRKRVKAIKLSELPGENVEEAVSLIKSTHKVLTQCSTVERQYVPDDFSETILKVFQTSSQPAFNRVFETEESNARHKADSCGAIAKCPTYLKTCTLALNTYRRMTVPGDEYTWCAPTVQGSAFLNHTKRRCFNCGKPGCIPSTCSQTLDPERIKKNRDLWQKNNPFDKSKRPSRRKPKDALGRPLKLNKRGAYVVDQKKHKANLAKKANKANKPPATSIKNAKQFADAVDALSACLAKAPPTAVPQATETETPVPATFTARLNELKQAGPRLFAPCDDDQSQG